MEFFNRQNQKPTQKPVIKGEGCKIKIKNTAGGKQISFEGQCTREQIEMAKLGLNDNKQEEEE